jgi:hypothetical protein
MFLALLGSVVLCGMVYWTVGFLATLMGVSLPEAVPMLLVVEQLFGS